MQEEEVFTTENPNELPPFSRPYTKQTIWGESPIYKYTKHPNAKLTENVKSALLAKVIEHLKENAMEMLATWYMNVDPPNMKAGNVLYSHASFLKQWWNEFPERMRNTLDLRAMQKAMSDHANVNADVINIICNTANRDYVRFEVRIDFMRARGVGRNAPCRF